MDKINIPLITITPIFAGRDDPCAAPELAPPALRGVLRYWFRALVGGVYGDDQDGIRKLREAECELFGGGVGGEEQLASSNLLIFPLSARLKPISVNSKIICNQQEKDYIDKDGKKKPRRWHTFPGLFYLYYSFRETGKTPDRKGLFYSNSQDSIINMRIAFRNPPSDTQFIQLHGALWLLTRFGGLGSRTNNV